MFIRILVILVQLIGMLVPFAGFVSLLKKARSRASMYLMMANLGCFIINASYMLLLQTTTYEGAIIAFEMEYLGSAVFYLMFGLFLWSYLKLKRHSWTKLPVAFWAILEVAFMVLLWSGDTFHLVFERLDFMRIEAWGLVLFRSVPGILYLMRYSVMCIILLCGMIYTTVRMFLTPIESGRNNLAKLVGAQFVIFSSLMLMLRFNFSFDIVPICASLSILSIIISVQRDEFFGITDLGQRWVFEQMQDAFIIVDEMYGYLDSNVYAGKIFPELDHKHQNEMVSGDMIHLFTDAEKIQRIHGKYYNKKVMEIREKGELSGYSLLLVDITEQYELMERVRQEKERADAANQAKSAFVSNVSHEIRTPMNAIVGMTQIMLRRDLPEQDREYLLNIQNSGNALLTIVNDLLDMSKIESGKMELVDEEYDFMSMLSDLGMIILNRIGAKPVELLFDIDPDIPAGLYGDALRIRQIIINLMNNATKFTEEGYVRLTVKVQEIKGDDIELFLAIEDTGQGIREEDIGKLFSTFQQVDAKKNHHKEGTGLGLSISKQLVELMHGTIGVKSEYGKGSEFYFTIHQRITDKKRAAELSGECRAVVAGSMKNSTAMDAIRKLAESYGVDFVEDVMTDKILLAQTEGELYYFTDRYEELPAEEKERLRMLHAVVCGLHNPMLEGDLPEDLLTIKKPLYSAPFCALLKHEKGTENDEDGETEDGTVRTKGSEREFTAPDAKILVVDDNEINCMVAEEMLKPLQMKIDLASDGEQALQMVQKSRYDMILMDHLMPVMDGVEATQAIRKLEGSYYKTVPVIALTGNTAKEQREEYIQAGMSDYLAKPIDMQEMYHLIRKWMPDKIR
ncbi:MAG: response regulator [Ruminococcus sp.]|nr:response regulator [Ruminococcus sp.]